MGTESVGESLKVIFRLKVVRVLRGVLLERWPALLTNVGSSYFGFQLSLPNSCAYNFIYISCHKSINIDVDNEYGPSIEIAYDDPNCIADFMAFMLAILSVERSLVKRPYNADDVIDLAKFRRLNVEAGFDYGGVV